MLLVSFNAHTSLCNQSVSFHAPPCHFRSSKRWFENEEFAVAMYSTSTKWIGWKQIRTLVWLEYDICWLITNANSKNRYVRLRKIGHTLDKRSQQACRQSSRRLLGINMYTVNQKISEVPRPKICCNTCCWEKFGYAWVFGGLWLVGGKRGSLQEKISLDSDKHPSPSA